VIIRRVVRRDRAEWLRMRDRLWPGSRRDHELEIDRFFTGGGGDVAVFVAMRSDGRLGGFVEASPRPYAEGCSTSPVGYVEGWWVDPDLRRTGVGRRLIAAAEAWARARGLVEMASDAELVNEPSHAAHRALGYREVERLVCFRKRL